MMKDITIIGRAEKAAFPDLNVKQLPVKIDTGADACSIWATATELESGRLHVIFFGEGSSFYTGEEHVFKKNEYSITRVANSFGHREIRYKVKLRIKIKGRLIKGSFTLSDRSNKLYPVLIGRTLLKHKFIVDVSKGSPLREEERIRAEKLRRELNDMKGGDL
jgi:hypothetical protein